MGFRNSMSNEKLHSFAILAIENECTQLSDNEKVIDAFAASHKKTDA